MHCLGSTRPCPKSSPSCLHPCGDPLCLCAILVITIACSHDLPELACVRTLPPASGLMASGQV
eukprot:12969158-Alexandrium_andersonii.AAC.1